MAPQQLKGYVTTGKWKQIKDLDGIPSNLCQQIIIVAPRFTMTYQNVPRRNGRRHVHSHKAAYCSYIGMVFISRYVTLWISVTIFGERGCKMENLVFEKFTSEKSGKF